jgi:murein DD-endopeptidase MepM/ murein hydrolase activator NlpD
MVFLSLLVGFANPVLGVQNRSARAQADQPSGPVYVIQPGDTLWDIAQRFGISLADLKQANGLTDNSVLIAGDELLIPGLEGIQGKLVTERVDFGESLTSLSRRYQVSEEMLAKLNHLTSPAELFAGASLVMPEGNASKQFPGRVTLHTGQSLLELAVLNGTDPWTLMATNAISNTWDALPGDVLHTASSASKGPGALPEVISAVKVDPLPVVQGKTAVVLVKGNPGPSLQGTLAGRELHFFPDGQGQVVALQGVHAMLDPGLYPLTLKGVLEDGTLFSFSQQIGVRDGQYLFDLPLQVPPETLDPAVTQPEDSQWMALAAPATSDKIWDGSFAMPSPLFTLDYCLKSNQCWSSRFGSRRSYNGSPYTYFHTGLDFYGGKGTKILAPAAGVVVFSGFLTVRGNATMINHGWGVYSAYMHQSEIMVKAGDRVETGQVIGLVGGTGRVEGPHLHFEIFVGGVQVEPLDWLERAFP